MEFGPSFPTSWILLASIAGASVLIYLPFGVVAYGRFQTGYNRAAPRAEFDKLPPYAQRATWAHQNAFESFMTYTAGALMAYVTQVDSLLAIGAAIAYLIARSLYPLFYILNLPALRSMMFGIGSAATATLMVLSLLNAAKF
jgi:uncharacterized MAPEG superfamily protein